MKKVFYSSGDERKSDTDSADDCQRIVTERCTNTQIRLARSRRCVNNNYPCTDECAGTGGELNSDTGRLVIPCLNFLRKKVILLNNFGDFNFL